LKLKRHDFFEAGVFTRKVRRSLGQTAAHNRRETTRDATGQAPEGYKNFDAGRYKFVIDPHGRLAKVA
jgi:hypothetical protein